MMALTFDIHLLTPLLATRLGGDPNSAISYPYVPGSVIRGALVNRYKQSFKSDLTHSDSRRLFFDGSTRYLNAYPLDRLKKRTFPVPLSWVREKEEPLVDGATIYDLAVDEVFLDHPKQMAKQFFRLDEVPDNQSYDDDVPADEDYWESEPPTVEFTDLEWQIAIHTARERLKGRATEEEGAVFRYQALATGQSFGGVILLSSPDDAETVKELLQSGDFWLGKSRSAGYGQVRIENVQPVPNWHETGGDKGLSQGSKVTIMLLSDLLLRTNEGVFADRLSEDILPEPLKRSLKLVDSFRRVVPVGGFSRKWGLPLDQAYVIQAGSVFVFDVTQSVSTPDVRAVENAGIGERRAEGFGRIAINWLRAEELTVREITTENSSDSGEYSSDSTVPMTSISQALAHKMVERLLRRDLERCLAGYVQGLKLTDNLQPISNAQLSRLRTIALNALPKHDIKRLLNFLGDNNLKAKARTQFEMARIADTPALEWLRQQLKAFAMIWQRLGGGAEIRLPRIGEVEAELTEDLAKEYTIRLIAGILHRAAKERKLEQKEGKGATNG